MRTRKSELTVAVVATMLMGTVVSRAGAQTAPPPQTPQTPTSTAPSGPPIPSLDFDAVIARALAKNPTVAQAATAIARAEALLEQARAVVRPNANLGITSVTLNQAYGFDDLITQPQNQVTFAATLNVPILDPARWAAVNQARDQGDVAQKSTAEARQQIAVAAAEAYLSVIASHRQVEVDIQALDDARAHLDYAQKRLDAGGGSRLNQLRAAQEASADQVGLENTRLALRRAQEALGVLVVENGPMDSAGEPPLDVPATDDESQWMAARADVQYQTAFSHAAERVVNDSRKDWYPTAVVSFVPQYVTPAGLFQPSKTWRLAVSFSQQLFDSGARRSALHLRQVTLEQSNLALTAIQIQARADVRLARESLASYERALTSARLAADQAAEVLRITTSAFEVGATTNLEVIDAQRSSRDAALIATVAEDALRHARLDLLVALGRFPR